MQVQACACILLRETERFTTYLSPSIVMFCAVGALRNCRDANVRAGELQCHFSSCDCDVMC